MYKLTPRMEQFLRQDLEEYHRLFGGGRCSGTQLEEFIFRSIQLDSDTGHHAMWKAGGHEIEADIRVVTESEIHPLQIKSGTIKNGQLRLSGYRLGRFEESLEDITKYLNSINPEILSVSYRAEDDENGRHHIYQIMYVNSIYLHDLAPDSWEKSGTHWRQTNRHGVIFQLYPKMSWQIWWAIPEVLLDKSQEIVIE